jgi:hypothetical protein
VKVHEKSCSGVRRFPEKRQRTSAFKLPPIVDTTVN